MYFSFRKILLFSLSAIILAFAVYQIFSIYNSARKTLADERARLLDRNRVASVKKSLIPHLSNNVRILQNHNEIRDFVRFGNSFFAATSGGLVQFDAGGKTEKHFTVLDGLPESDLTALAVFDSKLFIGTRTKNLIVFDGEKFENYIFTDRQAHAITAFIESDGKLLIGTFSGGLIEFDGAAFTEIKAENKSIKAINCLYKSGAKLFVGTFADGLWLYESGVWTHFTRNEGLPSNRIVGFASKDKKNYVATDLGLTVSEEKRFRIIADLPAVSSLISHENKLFLTKSNGEIYVFDSSIKEFSAKENFGDLRLTAIGENLYLLSNQGVFTIKGAKIKAFNQTDKDALTDNFVSAMAFDKRENLWVGTFRRGIDIFASDGKKIKHIESETLREINFLQTVEDKISAATAAGFFGFKDDFSEEILVKKEDLPSISVTHFSGGFIATAKGLAFRENSKIRALSSVNGLPNNAVYTTLQIGEKLYAGTLGGLAEIRQNRVVRVWKDSNSNLTTNWVTALVSVKERIFIGTYGGGIFELLPSGEIRSFEAESGKFTVNPNAIFADEERLYIGTLTGAKILDLQTQKWQSVRKILPSETVMSIASNGENIYFGTTNGIAKIEKIYFEVSE